MNPTLPTLPTLNEACRVLELESQSLIQCAHRLRESSKQTPLGAEASNWIRAVDLMNATLNQGGKIVVTGVGKSGKIAQKIAATFSSTGSAAVYLHPTEGLHGDLGLISRGDCILALSYTGNTEELLRLLPSLKHLQVPIIGLGGKSHSQLALHCIAWIDGSVEREACPHNLAPTTSTTLALALGDALAIALMQLRGFNPNDFAMNHPGGALGKRLNLHVSDLMKTGNSLAVTTCDASMDEVIRLSTEKKLGAVLIFSSKLSPELSNTLEGIVTDGDLRRALQHREKFFNFKAEEIMTKKPTTCLPEMMAYDALKLMENRPSQISVLPVVDSQGQCVGLIRLHDLIQSL